jgi:hypothetical protein
LIYLGNLVILQELSNTPVDLGNEKSQQLIIIASLITYFGSSLYNKGLGLAQKESIVQKKYLTPFILITSLFALWGFPMTLPISRTGYGHLWLEDI